MIKGVAAALALGHPAVNCTDGGRVAGLLVHVFRLEQEQVHDRVMPVLAEPSGRRHDKSTDRARIWLADRLAQLFWHRSSELFADGRSRVSCLDAQVDSVERVQPHVLDSLHIGADWRHSLVADGLPSSGRSLPPPCPYSFAARPPVGPQGVPCSLCYTPSDGLIVARGWPHDRRLYGRLSARDGVGNRRGQNNACINPSQLQVVRRIWSKRVSSGQVYHIFRKRPS